MSTELKLCPFCGKTAQRLADPKLVNCPDRQCAAGQYAYSETLFNTRHEAAKPKPDEGMVQAVAQASQKACADTYTGSYNSDPATVHTNIANAVIAVIMGDAVRSNTSCVIGETAPSSPATYGSGVVKSTVERLCEVASATQLSIPSKEGDAPILSPLPPEDDNYEFEQWWVAEGQSLDPDTDDVPWFDKRKQLCAYAFYYGNKLGQKQGLSFLKRETTKAIAANQWNEDDGAVLWWRLPVEEPPYCGTPLDGAMWTEDYYTHFTRLPRITHE